MTDKLCKDCRWCRRSFFPAIFDPYLFATCVHPSNVEKNLVSAKVRTKYRYCSTVRNGNSEDSCGQSGRWFDGKR